MRTKRAGVPIRGYRSAPGPEEMAAIGGPETPLSRLGPRPIPHQLQPVRMSSYAD
jgi:hypothetical protein